MQKNSNLVLSRKSGESILIGDDILVTVHQDPSRKNLIKVAIAAPKHVKIMRTELLDTHIAD